MLKQSGPKVRHIWLKVLLALICSTVAGLGFASSSVSAAEDGEFFIIASVQNQVLVNDVPERTPVAGASIKVTTTKGILIGEGITGADGLCKIAVPTRDNYLIDIDTTSLPNGLTLIDADKAQVKVDQVLFTTNTKRVTFLLETVALRAQANWSAIYSD